MACAITQGGHKQLNITSTHDSQNVCSSGAVLVFASEVVVEEKCLQLSTKH